MKTTRDKRKIKQMIEKYRLDQIITDIDDHIPYMHVLELERLDFIQTGEDYANCLYFYAEGRFKLYAEMEDGRRKLLRFCEGPMMLGEMELLGYKEDLACCIEAVSYGKVLVLDFRSIQEMLLSDAKLLRFICESFAEKMAFFGRRQTANAIQFAEEKVLEYMSHSVREDGVFSANLRVVAEELDISYRHLHRILSACVDAGKISRTDTGYKLIKN